MTAPAIRTAGRLAGVDVARGLAVLGMFAAHTVAREGAETLVNGRSSVLFAVLAGLSIGLMTRPGVLRNAPAEPRWAAVRGIAVRGLLLFLLGSALWALDSGIAVILDYYGIAFLLVLPLLFAPRWAIASVAVLIAAVGPRITQALAEEPGSLGPGAEYVVEHLFTGYYPAFSWTAYLAIGLLCARSDLSRPVTRLLMVLGGGLAACVGYGAAEVVPGLSASAHANTTLELVASGGFAVAVVGLLLLLTSRAEGASGAITGGLRVITIPLAAVGRMPLTLYTIQIIVLTIWRSGFAEPELAPYPWQLLAGMIVGAIVVAMLWQRLLGAGPLERALRIASRWPPGPPSCAVPA